MGVVIDANGRTVVEADTGGALDLREQQIGLVSQPADFETASLDRAILDLGAVVIGHQLAAADLAEHLSLVGQPGRILVGAADEQVGGTAIDRHGVDFVLGLRAVDHGLVVTGDKALAFAEPRNPQRQKVLLEEGFCGGAVGEFETLGDTAGIAQRRSQRFRIGRCAGLRRDRLAADPKRLVGDQMVVIAPAGDFRPGHRRILAAIDLKRQFELRIRQWPFGRRLEVRLWLRTRMTRQGVIPWSHRQRERDHAKREPCKGLRFSSRFRCQPASSSDRVRSCRGRMSRHR